MLLTARKAGFLGVRYAAFELTEDGRVILHNGSPSGEDVTARCGGPLGGPGELPAAVTALGWEATSWTR